MKKIFFAAFAMAALSLASCGNKAEEAEKLPDPVKVHLNSSSTSGEFMKYLSPYLDSLEVAVTAVHDDTLYDMEVMSALRSDSALNIKSVTSAKLEVIFRDSADNSVTLPMLDIDLAQNDSLVALVKAGEGIKAKKMFRYKGQWSKAEYEGLINAKRHFILLKEVKLEKAE